jgi:hypothetical protein
MSRSQQTNETYYELISYLPSSLNLSWQRPVAASFVDVSADTPPQENDSMASAKKAFA